MEAIASFRKGGWQKNLAFLGTVVIGLLLGIAVLASVIDFFLETFPSQTVFAFLGLILGSLPYIVSVSGIRKPKPSYLLIGAAAFALVAVMALAPSPGETEPLRELTLVTAALVFGTGIISAATMVLPGISGSFVLLLIGMYSTFITGFKEFNLPILIVYFLGAVVGIGVMARVMRWLFSRFHQITYAAIIGLVLGSIVSMWPGMAFDLSAAVNVGICILFAVVAFVLGGRKKSNAEEETPD